MLDLLVLTASQPLQTVSTDVLLLAMCGTVRKSSMMLARFNNRIDHVFLMLARFNSRIYHVYLMNARFNNRIYHVYLMLARFNNQIYHVYLMRTSTQSLLDVVGRGGLTIDDKAAKK